MTAKDMYNRAYSAYRKIASTPGIPQDAMETYYECPDYIWAAVVESRRFRHDPMEWRNPVSYRIHLEARLWHRRNPSEYK